MSAIFGYVYNDFRKYITYIFYNYMDITFITIIPTAFMDKRTKFGTEMYGKVLGLKEFIEHAEKIESICYSKKTLKFITTYYLMHMY